MVRRAIVYRILVASASDVIDDREAIIEVIHAWNAANSYYQGAYLEPVILETHATHQMGGRPQAITNEQLVKNYDILIGVFWTRLGTPTVKAESATVEEIKEFRKAGKPVLLYFSSAPIVLGNVDVKQYKRLLEFKEQCQKEGLVFGYKSIGDLQEQLQRHITTTINSIHSN